MSIYAHAAPLLFALSGCAEERSPVGDGWPACEVDPAFSQLAVESTGVATVGRARWRTRLRGAARVVYADSVGPVRSMPAREDASALLVGVGPHEEVDWRVVVDTEDGARCSALQRTRTGLHDAETPEPVVSGVDSSGTLAATVLLGERAVHVVLLDAAGRIVWTVRVAESPVFGPYRVRLAPDGRGLDVAFVAGAREQDAQVVRLDWDGVETARFVIRGGHTDMATAPDGTVAMLGWDIRTLESGRTFIGDTLLERAPDGEVRRLWSVFDDLTPDLSYTYGNSFYPTIPSAEDWTHGAGISYDAVHDSYLVALRRVSTILEVDRHTGTTVQRVGTASPAAMPGAAVEVPHSVEHVGDDRFLVFNSGGMGDGSCSRATVLHADAMQAAGVVEADYASEDCLRVAFLGNASAQHDDSIRVAWSSEGRLETFARDGTVVQRVELPVGTVFGFVTPVSSSELR